MKKYKTHRLHSELPIEEQIQVVEIRYESEHYYHINGSRVAKFNQYCDFHDTHEEAKQKLIEQSKAEIKELKWKLAAGSDKAKAL